MHILRKLLKVIIGFAIAIPLLIVVLVTTVGVLGTLLGRAVVALKLACFSLAGYALYRLAKYAFAPPPKAKPASIRELPELRYASRRKHGAPAARNSWSSPFAVAGRASTRAPERKKPVEFVILRAKSPSSRGGTRTHDPGIMSANHRITAHKLSSLRL